jgi:glycosyltransferase involved in cell wall biosynthesis
MAAGVPVLAGRAGSLPEVLGDAAVFVDPLDDDAIADGLQGLLDDPDLRMQFVARGREHIRRYEWGVTAERFAHLYRQVA